MSPKLLLLALGLAAVLAYAWHDPATLRGLAGAAQRWWVAAPPAPTPAPAAAPRAADSSGALRRCTAGSSITYTDGPCPAGSREEAVTGGTLSVLPPPGAPAAAPGRGGTSPPHARDLLAEPDAAALEQRRMDAVIGR